MWRVFKQALDRERWQGTRLHRRAAVRSGVRAPGKRHRRTGETALHLHALIGGLQYRGDRLERQTLPAAASQGRRARGGRCGCHQEGGAEAGGPVTGSARCWTSRRCRRHLAERGRFEVAGYLGKYLANFFENLAEWLPEASRSSLAPSEPTTGPDPASPGRGPPATPGSGWSREALRTAPASGEAPEEPERLDVEAVGAARTAHTLAATGQTAPLVGKAPGPAGGPLEQEEEVHHSVECRRGLVDHSRAGWDRAQLRRGGQLPLPGMVLSPPVSHGSLHPAAAVAISTSARAKTATMRTSPGQLPMARGCRQ